MRYLLDSHALIWYASGHKQLSETAREIIENFENERLISIASIWEMGIKSNIGKLTFEPNFQSFIQNEISLLKYEILPIEMSHISQMETLPIHHRDPFDRIMIAQAIVENIPLVSVDSAFEEYPIEVIW